MNDKRITLFSCGTQRLDWMNRNCCRCKKYPETEDELYRLVKDEPGKLCPIDVAVSRAAIDDGTVSPEIAKRIGYKPMYYSWECGEIEYR